MGRYRSGTEKMQFPLRNFQNKMIEFAVNLSHITADFWHKVVGMGKLRL